MTSPSLCGCATQLILGYKVTTPSWVVKDEESATTGTEDGLRALRSKWECKLFLNC